MSKSKKEKNDLSWWKELYPKMMMEKARIAASESVLRGKLRGKIELGKKLEEISLKVEEHVNDSELEGIDMYKVYNDGTLISELIIYDDAEVRELPRSRPQVKDSEILLYYQYAKSQGAIKLFDIHIDEFQKAKKGNKSAFSEYEFALWLAKEKNQKELMEILDAILNNLYKTK